MASLGTGAAGERRSFNHDLPLVPFIDFLLCLVAFLLVTAVWTSSARLEASARVPGQSGEAPKAPVTELHVAVQETHFELTWRSGATVVEQQQVARRAERLADGDLRYPELQQALQSAWDRSVSTANPAAMRAVLHTPNSAGFGEVAAVLDALHAPKRLVATGPVPVFAVSFAVD